MLQGRFSVVRLLSRFAFVALLGSVLTGWAATFPLPTPTRPTSFPLKRPAITGTVVGWGSNSSGQTSVQAGLIGVVAIAAGEGYTVALKSDGTVVAWGNNEWGQLNVPAGLNDVVAIAAGEGHTVALKSDGTLVAWGLNNEGQTKIPVGLSGVVAIAAGTFHTVALKDNGTVVAWGRNAEGQTTVPSGLSGVVAIAAEYHTVALVNDGTVDGRIVTWGGGPAMPGGLSGVVAIAAGSGYAMALKSDGTVLGWGGISFAPMNVVAIAGHYGLALGLKSDGTVVASGGSTVPVGLSDVVAIAAGNGFIVALVNDGLSGPNGATAKATVVNGFMVGVSVIGGGHGYTVPPLVVIKGGGGTGATATAIVADGSVVGFTVTNPGSGYTSLPLVLIASPPFAPEVAVRVSRVAVDLKVVLGRKYQLQASKDLKVWTVTGTNFVADSESLTQEFVVAEVGSYFRLVEVP